MSQRVATAARLFATLAAHLDRFLGVRDLRWRPYEAAKAAVESSDLEASQESTR